MLRPSFLSDDYMVSDEGYVLNKKGTKPLTPSINHKGYQIVQLVVNGKSKGIAVHTLVARAFCEGYKEGLTVNHIDGNKQNNQANNLEWVTIQDNIRHALYDLQQIKQKQGGNNPNSKPIYAIKDNIILKFNSIIEASKYLKPKATYKEQRSVQNCIVKALKGSLKTYKQYEWKYAPIAQW